MLQIREESGPDSVYWLGSAKYSNEMAYLCRKFAAFWGSNNVDHQARICHSTTVAGVANSFGYGAMTNSLNDIHNAKAIFLIGGNPAEAHPVSMLHVLHAKENGAKLMVIDPRFTRTAAHADEFVRVRTGSDIAFMWGVLWHIFQNGWEDKEYIQNRVFGMDAARKEVERYTPEEVERITGVAPDQVERVARVMAENRPSMVIWCMGLTQSHVGSSNTRAAASCSWRSATSASRAAAPTSSAVTTTSRAPRILGCCATPCPGITASRKTAGGTGPGSGRSTTGG
jgi:formate dehydrogenase major subunit